MIQWRNQFFLTQASYVIVHLQIDGYKYVEYNIEWWWNCPLRLITCIKTNLSKSRYCNQFLIKPLCFVSILRKVSDLTLFYLMYLFLSGPMQRTYQYKTVDRFHTRCPTCPWLGITTLRGSYLYLKDSH